MENLSWLALIYGLSKHAKLCKNMSLVWCDKCEIFWEHWCNSNCFNFWL